MVMSGNNEESGNQVLIGTRETGRAIISWQQERYHHVQSLARGLLGSILTSLAVSVTVLTAFDYRIPKIPAKLSIYNEVAQNLMMPTSGLVLQLISFLNILLFFTLIALSSVLFIAAVGRLYNIISSRPLSIGVSSSHYVSIVHRDTFDQIMNETGLDPVSSKYKDLIRKNQSMVESLNSLFTQATMRILLVLLFLIGGIGLYYQLANSSFYTIFLINIGFITPSSVTTRISKELFDIQRDDIINKNTSLSKELLLEDDPVSRWGKIQTSKTEKILIATIQLVSFLSLLVVGISLLL